MPQNAIVELLKRPNLAMEDAHAQNLANVPAAHAIVPKQLRRQWDLAVRAHAVLNKSLLFIFLNGFNDTIYKSMLRTFIGYVFY